MGDEYPAQAGSSNNSRIQGMHPCALLVSHQIAQQRNSVPLSETTRSTYQRARIDTCPSRPNGNIMHTEPCSIGSIRYSPHLTPDRTQSLTINKLNLYSSILQNF